jgi:hypothetical protein
VTEQASAQRDLLRTPSVVLGPIQPSAGTPPQMILGLTNSLADDKKASLTMKAARTTCALYNAQSEAQLRIYYALPSIEKDVLRHRLDMIQQASDNLDKIIADNSKLVDAQNLTRPAVYSLRAAKLRLDTSRTVTLAGIASPYVPKLSDTPLRVLVGEKLEAEEVNQKALARVAKEDGWDLKLTGGAHRQLNQSSTTFPRTGGFGEFSLTYNFGRRAAERHLDGSVSAYIDWKKNQLDDVVQQALILKQQILDSISIQEAQLKLLLDHDAEIAQDLQSLTGVETSSALSFKNQLLADKTVLRVDVNDVQFRLERLHEYLKTNFNE